MAAKNKAKYEVQVDIDVKTGKVDTTSALKELEDKTSRALSELKTQSVELPVKFDAKKSKQDIAKQYKALQSELDRQAKVVAGELKRKGPIAAALHSQLRKIGDTISVDGKIASDKLRVVLQRMAVEAGKSPKLTKQSPFAEFLGLGGKDLDKSLAKLESFSKGYQQVLNNLAKQSKVAATSQEAAFKKIDGAVKVSADKAAVAAQKRTKAAEETAKAQKRTASSGYNFGKSLDDISRRSNSATASIKRYNEETAKTQLANFSASIGFSQAQAKAKIPVAKQQDLSKLGDTFAPEKAAKGFSGFMAAMNRAGASADATRKKYNLFRDTFQKTEPVMAAAAAGGYNFGKSLDDISRRSNSATTSLRTFNKEAEATKLASFSSRLGFSQAKVKQPVKTSGSAVVSPVPSEVIKSYKGFAQTLTGTSGAFDFMSSASDRASKRVRTGAESMAAGMSKLSALSAKARIEASQYAKEVETAASKTAKAAVKTTSLSKSYDALQRAISRVESSKGLPASDQIRALEGQKRALLNYIAELQHTRKELKATGQVHGEFNRKLNESRKQLKRVEASLRGPTKSIAEFGNSLRLFLRYAVAYKVLGAVTQSFRFLTGSVIELQDALTSIKAVANATESDMVAIENAIKNVATTTKFTTQEIAQAAQTLAQAGIGPKDITKTLSGVANFASATNASLQVGADLISTMKNVFDELDVEEIADKLTNAVNISKLTPTGLQTILSRLAQTVKAFKINADQMFAAVAVLKNVGIKDSTVSTGLRQGILELLSPDAKTLKVLEKRYAAIGNTMSQAAIRTMFTSFSQDDNPLLRVINELEKLGIAGSGASDFERVFDVRAENVIKALIANKAQFIANTEAIGRTGSAAKGAETQLESLKNAASNLAATISVVASDLSGPMVDGLKGMVDWATEGAKSLRDLLLAQKELKGSTGVGSALETGAVVGVGSALLGRGAIKSVGSAIAASAVALVANISSGKTKGAAAGSVDTLTKFAEGFGIALLISKFLPSKQSVGTLVGVLTRLKAILAGGKGKLLFTVITAGVSRLGLIGAAIGGLYAIYTNFFEEQNSEELLDAIVSKRDSLAKNLDDAKNELAAAQANLDRNSKQKVSQQALAADLENISIDLTDFIDIDAIRKAQEQLAENTPVSVEELGVAGVNQQFLLFRDAVAGNYQAFRDIVVEAAKGTKDIGSESFQEVLEALAAIKSVEVSSFDNNALATMFQTMSDLTSKAEGARKEYLNAYQAALESPETLGNQDIIESFEGLSGARKAALFDVISDFDEAEAYLQGVVNDTQSGVDFEDAVRKSRDKVLADQKAFIDNLIEAAETAIGAEGEEEHTNTLKAAVLKAAIKGNTKLVNAYAGAIEGLLGGDFAGKAIQLAEEAAKAEFENRLRSSLNKARSSREDTKAQKTQKDLGSLGTASEEGRAQEAKDRSTALRNYRSNQLILDGLIAKQIALREEALALSEGSKTITQASKDKEAEAVSLQVQINNVRSKVLGFQKEEARAMEKLAELDNSFLIEQAAVKEINRQISVAKKSQQQDVSKTAELIKEGFLIEQDYLTRREKFINEQLKNVLKAEGFGQNLGSKSLEQILTELDNQGGRDLIKDNTILSGLVKEAIETRTKLTTAEESLRQQLDDTLRKPLDDNLKKAQSKLTKQHSETEKLESQLGKASDQLKKARENLAKVYDKEAEDLQFFKALDREIAGEEAQQKGDAKDLNKQARKAGTTDESVSLAKEAGSLAASLLSEGKITRREAEKISKESKSIVAKARAEEKAEARAEIDRRKREFAELSTQHAESLNSEAALQGSVDRLKLAIENLPARILEAMGQAQGSSEASTGGSKAAITPLTPEEAKGVRNRADKDEGLRVAAAQIKAAEESKQKLKEGGKLVGEAGHKLASSADKLVGAAGALARTAGQVSASFISGLGKNTGDVAEGDRFRSEAGQQGIISSYDRGELSQASAEKLLADLKQSLNPSVITGFSVGGLIKGPGSGTSDTAGNFALSNREYVHPSKATDHYGVDFMEQVRTLKFSAAQVRAVTAEGYADAPYGGPQGATTGADAVAGALKSSSASNLRPVTLNVGGAKFSSQASDRSISSFRDSLSMQALKVGTK